VTIARRLAILAAVPLVVLLVFAVLNWVRLEDIETRTRFAAENQVQSLAALGNISKSFAEMRVNLRSCVLSRNDSDRLVATVKFGADESAVARGLKDYADRFVSDPKDRRLLDDFRALSGQWTAGAKRIMAAAKAGREDEAKAILFDDEMAQLGVRLSSVSSEWIQHS